MFVFWLLATALIKYLYTVCQSYIYMNLFMDTLVFFSFSFFFFYTIKQVSGFNKTTDYTASLAQLIECRKWEPEYFLGK